jgi:hypothetical protein
MAHLLPRMIALHSQDGRFGGGNKTSLTPHFLLKCLYKVRHIYFLESLSLHSKEGGDP